MNEANAPAFDPQVYWERRLREHTDIVGVGYLGRSPAYVALQYQQRMHQASLALGRDVMNDLTRCSVLDVGSGIGIWLTFWHQHHARQVVGLDFTAASVERLRADFATDQIVQADISERPLPSLADATFDLISAFDVLLHIVDAQAFRRAVANIADHCKAGGWFVMADPLLAGQGYVSKPDDAAHVVVRTLEEYRTVLDEHGFTIERVLPATVLLNRPREGRNRLIYRALVACWVASFTWERSLMLVRLTSPIILWLDRLACRLTRNGGPSEKIVVARKRA